jgi:hypothetical protein
MDDVLFMYDWFKKAMMSVGRKTSDPKCADIKKTYQYRSVNQFVDKARDYGLDIDQMQALVKEIIKYAKDRKLLHRGTAVLNMADIFSICSKRLEMGVEEIDMSINLIKSSMHLIEDDMHLPEHDGGYPKLISLRNSDLLPVELLAISRKCVSSLQKLGQADRQLLPSDTDLLKIRIRMLMDRNVRSELKAVLGDDLLESGVPS